MKLTNKYKLPPALVDCIQNLIYDPTERDPRRIGITTLIGAPLPRLLTVKHWDEIEEDISDHIWRLTGQAYHYILAKTTQKDRLIEKKLEEEIDGITIVGKLDLYEPTTKSIEDYKICSVWQIINPDKKEWERQINCYAWLLRKNKIKVEKGYINAILRDWSRTKAKQDFSYPQIPFARIEVPIWSQTEATKYIKERVKIYKKALETPIEQLDVCTEEERWTVPEQYAIYKVYKGKKGKRAIKCCASEEEAKTHIDNLPYTPGVEFAIDKREAVDKKCQEYCLVSKFCPYWKRKMENKNEDSKTTKRNGPYHQSSLLEESNS